MAPIYRSHTSGQGAEGDVTLSKPVGTVEGDVLIAAIRLSTTSQAITPPSGWTLLEGDEAASSTEHALQIFYKVAGASEPVSYFFDWPTGQNFSAIMVCVQGGLAPDVVSGPNYIADTGTSITALGITTLEDDSYLGAFFSHGWPDTTISPPGGFTERIENNQANAEMAYADSTQASAGTTGDKSATVGSVGGRSALMFSIPPDNTAPTVTSTSPAHETIISDITPDLTVEVSDPDDTGNPITVDFEVATDPGFTNIIHSGSESAGVEPLVDQQVIHSVITPLSNRTLYYWRARSTDTIAYGLWSTTRLLFVITDPAPQGAAYVNASEAFTGGAFSTSITIPKPADVQEGDMLVAFLGCANESTYDTPAGWTLDKSMTDPGFDTELVYVMHKMVEASDVAATDFTFSGSGGANESLEREGILVAYREVDVSAGVAAGTETFDGDTSTPAATWHAPSITPDVTNSILGYVVGKRPAGASGGIHLPDGYMEVRDTASEWGSIAVGHRKRLSLSATGELSTGTTNGGGLVGLQWQIAPAFAAQDQVPVTDLTATTVEDSVFSAARHLDRDPTGRLWAALMVAPGVIEIWHQTNGVWAKNTNATINFTAPTFLPVHSLFIDDQGHAHIAYNEGSSRQLLYQRMKDISPTTSWSAPFTVGSAAPYGRLLDMVAHQEAGNEWRVHIVSHTTDADSARYFRLQIQSNDQIVLQANDVVLHSPAGSDYSNSLCLDFHHTGDGKTVKDGTPHLFFINANGFDWQMEFRKATYASGDWTWEVLRTNIEQDWNVPYSKGGMTAAFDGTKFLIVYAAYPGRIRVLTRDVADTTTNIFESPPNDDVGDQWDVTVCAAIVDGDQTIHIFTQDIFTQDVWYIVYDQALDSWGAWQWIAKSENMLSWYDYEGGLTTDRFLNGHDGSLLFGSAQDDSPHPIAFLHTPIQPTIVGQPSIASTEMLGTDIIQSSLDVSLNAIASAESLGTDSVQGILTIAEAGIYSEEAFGAQSLSPSGFSPIGLTSIASEEALGVQSIDLGNAIQTMSIPSAEVVGVQSFDLQLTIGLSEINPAEAFGSQAISLLSLPLVQPGIDPEEALGLQSIQPLTVIIETSDIPSEEILGNLTIIREGFITQPGIFSTEALGTDLIRGTITTVMISSIASAESHGILWRLKEPGTQWPFLADLNIPLVGLLKIQPMSPLTHINTIGSLVIVSREPIILQSTHHYAIILNTYDGRKSLSVRSNNA